MWWEEYKDQGLEIIGVHTPEFAFERLYENVAQAAKDFGLTYPIVLDNDYATWNAFGNRFWPRKYLIDIDGYIVYDHAGEGEYEETEQAIRRALLERSERLGLAAPTVAEIAPQDTVPVDFGGIKSPEIYFGAGRNEHLANGRSGQTGTQTLTLPASFKQNTLYLGGTWDLTDEYAKNVAGDARIAFRYSAKNVYFVAAADMPVKVRILIDGKQPGEAHGADVSASGEAIIQQNRLYKLIENSEYGEHTLQIIIENPGLKAYTFTFG
jgi:hypothetical protein